MGREKLENYVAVPMIVSLLYTVYLYAQYRFTIDRNIFISLNGVKIGNLATKFLGDFNGIYRNVCSHCHRATLTRLVLFMLFK